MAGGRSQEGGHGRKNRTQVSHAGCVAQHPEATTHLSHAAGPAGGGAVAESPRTAGSRAALARQDAVRLAPQGVSRSAFADPASHVRAARPALARHGGCGAYGHVQPSASRRRSGRLGFHQHELIGSDDPRQTLRAYGLSLRAHVLELGIGNHLRVGVVRGVVRWLAERAVGTGRRSAAASQRQPERGGQ
jgi:hypothetical protein